MQEGEGETDRESACDPFRQNEETIPAPYRKIVNHAREARTWNWINKVETVEVEVHVSDEHKKRGWFVSLLNRRVGVILYRAVARLRADLNREDKIDERA